VKAKEKILEEAKERILEEATSGTCCSSLEE